MLIHVCKSAGPHECIRFFFPQDSTWKSAKGKISPFLEKTEDKPSIFQSEEAKTYTMLDSDSTINEAEMCIHLTFSKTTHQESTCFGELPTKSFLDTTGKTGKEIAFRKLQSGLGYDKLKTRKIA